MDKNKHSNKKKPFRQSQQSENRQNEAGGKSLHFDMDDTKSKKSFGKRSLQQPESRLADLDDIWQETTVGQDFETLVNAPLSTDGHFIFKSEKNWMLDSSKYDDFFSVNVKDLAMIVESIPFNQYVQVDNEYFSKDELTNINNAAEKGKKSYDEMIATMRRKDTESSSKQTEPENTRQIESKDLLPASCTDSQACQDATNLEEDLDFLLSLKEPIRSQPVPITSLSKSGSEESKTKNVPAATKSIDLEKWLDLVLEE